MSIALMIGVATLNAAETADLTAAEAGTHVGESVTVTDTVARVNSAAGGNIFINMGSGGRDQTFTVFISARSAPEFPHAEEYEGKTISVSGTVTTFKDKPQIAVTEPSQIVVKSDAAADTGKTDPHVPPSPSASPAQP